MHSVTNDNKTGNHNQQKLLTPLSIIYIIALFILNLLAFGCSSGSDTSSAVTDNNTNPDQWSRANLTNYTSYPDPDSDECLYYNGCTWEGMFAFLSGKQPESWVMGNNIAAVHSKDADTYKLKTLRLRQGNREIDVIVYDMCADSDCNGCCTENASETGFLIDIEKYTMERFGSGSGIVEWKCLDCEE